MHIARNVSHIGTPEWQSFELRMLERARVRRASRRRRRLRRASAVAVVLVLFVGAGGTYVDVMIEPGPDVREPARPFLPNGVVPPPLPSPILNPASTDSPMAVADSPETGIAPAPEVLDSPPPQGESAPPQRLVDAPARTVAVEAENRAATTAPSTRLIDPESRAESDRTTGTTGNGNVPPAPARSPAPAASPPPSEPVAAVEREPERREPISWTERAPVERSPEHAPVPLPPERAPDLPPATATTAPAPPPSPPAPAIDQSASIRGTIERYRRAYEDLDAAAARSVWPAVEEAALARAFGSLSSQRISFENCSIDVTGRLATASCRGTARVEPRVGGGTQSARRNWVFWLRQSGESWVIERTQIR